MFEINAAALTKEGTSGNSLSKALVKKDDVVGAIMEVVTANYEKNTIGVRLINTLIHQYFINGGLTQKEAKKVAFQKTLTLH